MGVGIPGTGMVGLPIAIALGVVAGKSAYGLEGAERRDADRRRAGQTIHSGAACQNIIKKEGISEKLYVEAMVESESGHRGYGCHCRSAYAFRLCGERRESAVGQSYATRRGSRRG